MTSKGILDTPLLFVTIFILAIVGIILYTSIIILEKIIFHYRGDKLAQGK
jgi:ABC-type nitrate/sulfonate/bicarbonate transport system permease component